MGRDSFPPMLCPVCEKESNNQRVCPYCFTPYRQDTPAQRRSAGARRVSTAVKGPAVPGASRAEGGKGLADSVRDAYGSARDFVMRQTPVVRWSSLGILIVLAFWLYSLGAPRADLAPGSVPSAIIASPMQREEAIALVKRTRETALVETQADEVMVSYPAATFPLTLEGQIALAQQFARADEIVEGRKRRIFFYNPSGRIFAHSDGVTGVTVAR